MLLRRGYRLPAGQAFARAAGGRPAGQINMRESGIDWTAVKPTSEATRYRNEFVQKGSVQEFIDEKATAKKPPIVTETEDLVPAESGDPHNTMGSNFFMYSYKHYDYTREPTHPKPPGAGELAVGALQQRTTVWAHPTEPAITSVARFEPSSFRPVGYAEHVPDPDTTVPEGHLDFRHTRLPTDHADRRPFIYFLSCSSGFVFASIIRAVVCKFVYTWWPSKDVFAAGVVEVNLASIQPAQNFIVKWRGKPIFVRKRTPEMIAAAGRDDAIIGSLRDPMKDVDRAPRPEWLVVLGVCTHLGCIPYPDQGLYPNGGYFCPCHGSHYDESGRIRAGPAPANLEVPPYSFIDDDNVRLG
jgi:ubiquinol-cytochrome c reductase iron-sulfur subunit